jgi:alpha-amylase/alpha-mannosidase (GH57 family)
MNRRSTTFAAVAALICATGTAGLAQPTIAPDGVRFTYHGTAKRSVSVVGDFNGWNKEVDLLHPGTDGVWSMSRALQPGIHQYKFLIDGTEYVNDPGNTALIDNYNRSSRNSVFVLTDENMVLLSAEAPPARVNPNDQYTLPDDHKRVFVHILWHQHQPLYANPETDQLAGPWVRTHGTKDYYDMAAMLEKYPDVHCTINLTSSLLHQLRGYYLDRLGPYIDARKHTIDIPGFWKQWKGKTDPWVDLALTPATSYTDTDRDLLYRNAWNAFGINDVMLERFPEYHALKAKLASAHDTHGSMFSVQEMQEIIFWFYLAHFDPDFLRGPVKLTGGVVCDLSDLVREEGEGIFRLKRPVTHTDCVRMVVEAYNVMAAIIPVHRALHYSPEQHTGQIDVITTPYYHPILPLIYDSELARICQPADTLPGRFSYPEDARAQVVKAVRMYKKIFGVAPTGMWPGEGSVAQPVLEILRSNGILWTASDVRVLQRSRPTGQSNTTPFRFPAGSKPMSLVFRDTDLSDRIGFKYQSMEGEAAAEDFVQSLLAFAPQKDQPDVLITVILDGENAWEWYRHDVDGKRFLNALYRKLTVLHKHGLVTSTTMSEYIAGNAVRGVPAHPVESQPAMEWLWPGSWINANYDTWIGEREENTAWEYLLQARGDLQRSGVSRPDPQKDPPRKASRAWNAYMAWEELYAAEGSDWFWWYGADQIAPAGDKPFDQGYIAHLKNLYRFAVLAGGRMPARAFTPIIHDADAASPQPDSDSAGQGVMGKSKEKKK